MILQKWKQCGTRRQGKDHVESKVPCQDNVAYLAANSVQAIALSDGGGSRRFSQIGSEFSTRAVCELLTEKFEDFYERAELIAAGGPKASKLLLNLRLEIIDHVLGALRTQVTSERTLQDFGCTLQFAAIKGGRYFVGHVGDGVISGLYQIGLSREVRVISHPENGGAPNVTFFVTDHDAKDHLRLYHGECHQLEGVLLMSDGPEEMLYIMGDGMHQNTQKLFDNFRGVTAKSYEQALQKFLAESVSKFSSDDLSLNLLYLESVEKEGLSPEYKKELFADVSASSQIRRVSQYAYLIDPTLPFDKKDDLSTYRS